MKILPAIDMKGGRPVRLLQGEMDKETVYGTDLVAMAHRWASEGAEYLHLVDLDGAIAGSPQHMDAVAKIVAAIDVPCEIGGGVRTREDVERYLEIGVDRVIMGTSALADPKLFSEVCASAPHKVVVGIDARDGLVAVKGWVETSEVMAAELATRCEDAGAAALIFTDITRDGAMTGPAIDSTRSIAEKLSIPVIASGGISSIEDIKSVLEIEDAGVEGMIIGRALYEGSFSLRDAHKAIGK